MKQLITALVLSLSITATICANPLFIDKNPAHRNTKFEGGKDELSILPNPKTGNALLGFKADRASKGVVMVFDESGKVVLKQPVVLASGKNKININSFTNLQEGNYTVCLNTNHKIYSTAFLLWK